MKNRMVHDKWNEIFNTAYMIINVYKANPTKKTARTFLDEDELSKPKDN